MVLAFSDVCSRDSCQLFGHLIDLDSGYDCSKIIGSKACCWHHSFVCRGFRIGFGSCEYPRRKFRLGTEHLDPGSFYPTCIRIHLCIILKPRSYLSPSDPAPIIYFRSPTNSWRNCLQGFILRPFGSTFWRTRGCLDMLNTKSIWGALFFHCAADLNWFIAYDF